MPGDDEFTVAILGDLHLDPRKMEPIVCKHPGKGFSPGEAKSIDPVFASRPKVDTQARRLARD